METFLVDFKMAKARNMYVQELLSPKIMFVNIMAVTTHSTIFTFAYYFLNKKARFILHDPHGSDAQK